MLWYGGDVVLVTCSGCIDGGVAVVVSGCVMAVVMAALRCFDVGSRLPLQRIERQRI